MIYEWKCTKCGLHTDIDRPVSEYDVPPDKKCCRKGDWVKVYRSSTPFQLLKNAGIFPDQYGNIPPRKMD